MELFWRLRYKQNKRQTKFRFDGMFIKQKKIISPGKQSSLGSNSKSYLRLMIQYEPNQNFYFVFFAPSTFRFRYFLLGFQFMRFNTFICHCGRTRAVSPDWNLQPIHERVSWNFSHIISNVLWGFLQKDGLNFQLVAVGWSLNLGWNFSCNQLLIVKWRWMATN